MCLNLYSWNQIAVQRNESLLSMLYIQLSETTFIY